MLNDDNACIRYLMKEMDPSEEILIERAMMEDEDLLIEVESLRQTLKRLDDELPELEPPSHITEQIKRTAAERKPDLQSGWYRFNVRGVQYAAAAAVVIAGLFSGMLLIQNETAQDVNSADTETETTGNNRAAGVGTASDLSLPQPVGVREQQFEPWVDRNEVLRFQDQFSSEGRADYDSMLNVTTKKLRLIDDPLQINSRTRTLQMTGTDQ